MVESPAEFRQEFSTQQSLSQGAHRLGHTPDPSVERFNTRRRLKHFPKTLRFPSVCITDIECMLSPDLLNLTALDPSHDPPLASACNLIAAWVAEAAHDVALHLRTALNGSTLAKRIVSRARS
jgi:hypothetical protein